MYFKNIKKPKIIVAVAAIVINLQIQQIKSINNLPYDF
jgi:hypothetical protein